MTGGLCRVASNSKKVRSAQLQGHSVGPDGFAGAALDLLTSLRLNCAQVSDRFVMGVNPTKGCVIIEYARRMPRNVSVNYNPNSLRHLVPLMNYPAQLSMGRCERSEFLAISKRRFQLLRRMKHAWSLLSPGSRKSHPKQQDAVLASLH